MKVVYSIDYVRFPITVLQQLLKRFDFSNVVTLKTELDVRQDRQRAYDFLLMFYSNYGSISCRFFSVENIATLKSRSKVNQVIECGTNRYNWYGFLLVLFYGNSVHRTHRF